MAARTPIVMTLMVRDEVDLIAAMIEHHLAQGVDLIIATDNGSADGTREVLADYAALGVVELHDDPRHEKQQAEVVTRMARRAHEVHGAEWVLNADADEFWFASSGATIAEALADAPAGVMSFEVPVSNLFGPPLGSGSAIRSHTLRDVRDEESLAAVGLHAHPTSDCAHRGSSSVEIAQGNHFTDLPLADAESVPERMRLEVLHLPYRSWKKYRHRVATTAAAYAVSGLTPSPRHHGMRDAYWLEHDALLPVFVARHPAADEAEPAGFVVDTRLRDELEGLVESGARLPERLAEALRPPIPLADAAEQRTRFVELGPWLLEAASLRERLMRRESEFYGALQMKEEAEAQHGRLEERLEQSRRQTAASNATVDELNTYVANLLGNPAMRLVSRLAVPRYGWPERRRNVRALVGRATARVRRLVRRG